MVFISKRKFLFKDEHLTNDTVLVTLVSVDFCFFFVSLMATLVCTISYHFFFFRIFINHSLNTVDDYPLFFRFRKVNCFETFLFSQFLIPFSNDEISIDDLLKK